MSTLKYAAAIMLVAGAALSQQAWADHYGHGGGYGGGYGRGHVGIGIMIGGPAWGWPYYPPNYYYPYYYPAYPPQVIIQSPPVYVEQGVAAPPAVQVPDNYWYYCSNPQGYYPYIKECPAGWQKVLPQTPPPQ